MAERLLRTPPQAAVLTLLLAFSVTLANGDQFSGAIQTTNKAGVIVNQNLYDHAADVYISGGPQNVNAAGLPDGTYYFQVTDPSGTVLLSTDNASCRQLRVSGGRVGGSSLAAGFCAHNPGTANPANGATPVQMAPFAQTPNSGLEYKVWLIAQTSSTAVSASNPKVINFKQSDAKTDNFKLRVPPQPPAACSGQSLITIDPVHNVGYVPVYTLDATGNAQIAVIDLTVGAATPVIKTLSLPGAKRPIATAFNPNNNTMLVAAGLGSSNDIGVFVVDTVAQTLAFPTAVATPGLTFFGFFGGILPDEGRNRVIVAGTSTLGILDTSTSPPTWNTASVVTSAFTDSLSLNRTTGMLFISADGGHQIIDTLAIPMVPMAFNSSFGVTDGNAFDPETNILVVSQEVGADQTWAFNFNSLTTTPSPANANVVRVPNVCPGGGTSCLGETFPTGEGPGGQAVINCTTHQAVIADEYGHNLKLLQLPLSAVPATTPLNNNGRPGSGVPADAASVYTIATALIPQGTIGGSPTTLGMLGDPNSLAIDPAFNFAYALADPNTGSHPWTPGATTPLFLVRIDLSNAVPGASPTGGVNGATFWTPAVPATAAIRLP